MKKRFWIEKEMKAHLKTFRLLKGRERDRYWVEHMHAPINSCMNYAIPMIDKQLLNDEELRAELTLVILETLTTNIDLDSGRKVNILSYLIGTIKSKTLNYISGSSRQRGAALLTTHKNTRVRTVKGNNLSELDIKTGDRIGARRDANTWQITNYEPKFQRFDDDKHDVVIEKFSTIDWATVPWGSMHAFIYRQEATDRIKEIASACMEELGCYLKLKNRKFSKRDFFNIYMASKRPELRFARGEIMLVQAVMVAAYSAYLRIEKVGGLWEETVPTLCESDV